MRFRLLSAALLAVSFSTACISSSEPVVVPTIETTGFDASLGVNLAASTKTASGLYYRDIVDGSGVAFAAGDSVTVYYTGSFPNASVFDYATASNPFSFRLGIGRVIRGWDEGLPGMKIGGKRQLIIPPALGYGSSTYGPIPGNSILVFTVTAVGVR
jgi:FKBP-type peptidyl-prolyl cis-trans isomerase